MADIITYPENGITYDADDAAGHPGAAESGVPSSTTRRVFLAAAS